MNDKIINVGDTAYSVDFKRKEILTHDVIEIEGGCYHTMSNGHNITLGMYEIHKTLELALNNLMIVLTHEVVEATNNYENAINKYKL